MQRITPTLLGFGMFGLVLLPLSQIAHAQVYTVKGGTVVQHAIDASGGVYRVRGVLEQNVGPKKTGGVYTVYPGTLGVVLTLPDYCRGDLNGDGSTDLEDFNQLAVAFGATGVEPFSSGDLNGDGVVNLEDFNIFATNFGCSS